MSTGKKASNKKIEEYKNELLKEAETIVEEKFPTKVIEFNELLKNPKYQYDRLVDVTALDVNALLPTPTGEKINDGVPSKRQKTEGGHDGMNGVPIYGFAKGSVKCNEKLAELIDELRPLLHEAIEDVNKVKVWIQFLIPKIEDGNNFGVSIQEECLNETRNVEAEVAGFIGQISRYFASRARIVTKIAKYPHVDDYRRAMLDTDEKQFINIRLVIIEMRNHFARLYDLLMKNIDKIKTPRTSHAENMMY
uniref:Proteasome activator complex subunit 3 n=1 Tax=Globodera pallida TaxID=36090 RepID=A0A183CCE4_GLOPA